MCGTVVRKHRLPDGTGEGGGGGVEWKEQLHKKLELRLIFYNVKPSTVH